MYLAMAEDLSADGASASVMEILHLIICRNTARHAVYWIAALAFGIYMGIRNATVLWEWKMQI